MLPKLRVLGNLIEKVHISYADGDDNNREYGRALDESAERRMLPLLRRAEHFFGQNIRKTGT